MAELRLGSERVEETLERIFAALSSLMKRETLGLATIANLLEPLRDLVF